jgi:hypothetical protein
MSVFLLLVLLAAVPGDTSWTLLGVLGGSAVAMIPFHILVLFPIVMLVRLIGSQRLRVVMMVSAAVGMLYARFIFAPLWGVVLIVMLGAFIAWVSWSVVWKGNHLTAGSKATL